MMIGEAIVAGILGVVMLWLVAQPILAPQLEQAMVDDVIDPEETARGRALIALKEIEFDRATGKLSDEDFRLLTERYSRQAVEVMDTEAVPACPSCGAPDSGTAWCTACGVQRSKDQGASA
jgi:hypothetical protein